MSAYELTKCAKSSSSAQAKATQLLVSGVHSNVVSVGITTEMALETNPASISARLSLSDCPVEPMCILQATGFVDEKLCLSPLADEGRC
jgi:hypothetical protein